MKKLITLLLALAVCAGAVELYWDTGRDVSTTFRNPLAAVRFHDCEGPGDTGGREGTVYTFRVFYSEVGDTPASLYLYEPNWNYIYVPGEPLHEGDLEYDETQEGEWTVYTLLEPFEVPEHFFAVIEQSGKILIANNDDKERDCAYHSAKVYNDEWGVETDDICIRVEWEPDETAVVEASWGAIKAGI